MCVCVCVCVCVCARARVCVCLLRVGVFLKSKSTSLDHCMFSQWITISCPSSQHHSPFVARNNHWATRPQIAVFVTIMDVFNMFTLRGFISLLCCIEYLTLICNYQQKRILFKTFQTKKTKQTIFFYFDSTYVGPTTRIDFKSEYFSIYQTCDVKNEI